MSDPGEAQAPHRSPPQTRCSVGREPVRGISAPTRGPAGLIRRIQEAVSCPVMAKVRIGHFVEAQILEHLEVDFIGELAF